MAVRCRPSLGGAFLGLLLVAGLATSAGAQDTRGDPPTDRGAPPEAFVVQGLIVEEESDTPIEGAFVRFVGPDTLRTESGADGRWSVRPSRSGSYTATVSRIGYEDREMLVDVPGDAEVRVFLRARALALDELVVTASRRTQRLAEAPVTIEVVRAEEIRRSGAADVASVLTERTGIQLHAGHPNGAGVMLQGLDSERVLVLVDGHPWVGRISGTADLSRIPTSSVERIEIVKGPQAALYGSEAMGGVVNIITRRPSGGWSASGTLTSGSQDRLDAGARVTGHHGALAFTVEAGRRTESLIPGSGLDGGDASVVRRDGHARLIWAGEAGPERASALEARVLVVDEDQRWRSGQLRQFGDNVQGALTLEGRWTRHAHDVTVTLHGSRFDHLLRRGTRDEPPPQGTGDRQVQQLVEADLLWGWRMADPLVLDVGAEFARESIDAETVRSEDARRTEVEPYVQGTLVLGATSIVPGLRFTRSTRWGGHWTPRLALMTRATPALTLRASVSAGYRAPNFKELGLDFLNTGPGFGYLVRGNPDLAPETSRNLSAGAEWSGPRGHIRVQAFHNAFRDFIETRAVADSAGITLFTYGNIAEGHTAGVEGEVGGSAGLVDLELGYAWLATEDVASGHPLLGRPAHSGRASLSAPVGPLGFHLSGTWTGSTPMSRGAEGADAVFRDPFYRLDARASYRLGTRARMALGVDNLLDEAPAQWPGFAGRRIHITLNTTLFGAIEP